MCLLLPWFFVHASLAQSEAEILDFDFEGVDEVSVSINDATSQIQMVLPADLNLTSLVASFSVSMGASVTVDGAAQTSGTTENDFSAPPPMYRVTSSDGLTARDWTLIFSFEQFRQTQDLGISPTGGSAAWGDYDKDGDLDLVVTGVTAGAGFTSLYDNDASGGFSLNASAGFDGLMEAEVVFRDINRDGWLDLVLRGHEGLPGATTLIYLNQAGSSFAVDGTASIPGTRDGASTWFDMDNDGDLDLILTGMLEGSPISRIYRNELDNGFIHHRRARLQGVSRSALDAGDYNEDGWLDLIIGGLDADATAASYLYLNDGEGGFLEQPPCWPPAAETPSWKISTATDISTCCSRAPMIPPRACCTWGMEAGAPEPPPQTLSLH